MWCNFNWDIAKVLGSKKIPRMTLRCTFNQQRTILQFLHTDLQQVIAVHYELQMVTFLCKAPSSDDLMIKKKNLARILKNKQF